jgi:Tfp pilus assembly protein PilF
MTMMRQSILFTLMFLSSGCSRPTAPSPPVGEEAAALKLDEAQAALAGGNDDAAEECIEAITALGLPLTDFQRGRLCRMRAIILYHRGLPEQAADSAGEAVQADPDTPGHRLARAFYRTAAAGQQAANEESGRRLRMGAVEDLKEYLKLRPKHAGAWALLAVVSEALGDAQGAKDARARADQLDPKGQFRTIIIDGP